MDEKRVKKKSLDRRISTLAHTFLREGDHKRAAHAFKRASISNPGNPYHFYHLSCCLYELGDINGAEKAVKESLRIDSTKAEAFYQLGYVHWEANNLVEADAALTRALQLKGLDEEDKIMCYEALSFINEELGYFYQAQEYTASVLKLSKRQDYDESDLKETKERIEELYLLTKSRDYKAHKAFGDDQWPDLAA